jgi:hypothetical protein
MKQSLKLAKFLQTVVDVGVRETPLLFTLAAAGGLGSIL